MVLSRSLALLLLLLAACPRVPPQRLDTAMPIAVALVVDPSSAAPPQGAPPEVFTLLEGALQTRNLQAHPVPLEALRSQRLTEPRYQALKASGSEPWVLLIESRVTFFSQLDGRYRWLVSVKLSAGRRGAAGIEASDAFEAAAVLLYDHEREREAQLVVSDVIADRATRLLDQLIVAPSSSPAALDGGTAQTGPSVQAQLLAAAATRSGASARAPSTALAWCSP